MFSWCEMNEAFIRIRCSIRWVGFLSHSPSSLRRCGMIGIFLCFCVFAHAGCCTAHVYSYFNFHHILHLFKFLSVRSVMRFVLERNSRSAAPFRLFSNWRTPVPQRESPDTGSQHASMWHIKLKSF